MLAPHQRWKGLDEAQRDLVAAAVIVLAYAGYYVCPSIPISAALLSIAAFSSVAVLPVAVALVPLAMPFFMLPKHIGHEAFSLGETAIAITAAMAVVHATFGYANGRRVPLGRKWLFARRWPAGLVAIVGVAAAIAALLAFNKHVALRQYRVAIIEPMIYAALVVATLKNDRYRIGALLAVVASSCLVAVLGLGQYVFRSGTLSGLLYGGTPQAPIVQHLRLVSSVYASPDNLALQLDRGIPVCAVLLLWLALIRGGILPAMQRLLVVCGVTVLVLMVSVLLMTGSRGGMITATGVMLVGGIAVWISAGRRLSRGAIGAAAVVAVIVAVAVLWKVRHGLSTGTRIHVWLSSLRMIRDHPIFGVGPDNFLYYYFNPFVAVDPRHPQAANCVAGFQLPIRHYESAMAWQEPCLSHPHNMVLDLWLSTGILGLIAGLALVVWCGLALWREWRVQSRKAGGAIAIGVGSILLATVTHGLVDNALFLPDLGVLFWLAVGLAMEIA
jgi:O-antigen ligase